MSGETRPLLDPPMPAEPAQAPSEPTATGLDPKLSPSSRDPRRRKWRAKLASSLLLVSLATVCLGGAAVTVAMQLTLGMVHFPLWPLFAGLGLIAAGGAVALPPRELPTNSPLPPLRPFAEAEAAKPPPSGSRGVGGPAVATESRPTTAVVLAGPTPTLATTPPSGGRLFPSRSALFPHPRALPELASPPNAPREFRSPAAVEPGRVPVTLDEPSGGGQARGGEPRSTPAEPSRLRDEDRPARRPEAGPPSPGPETRAAPNSPGPEAEGPPASRPSSLVVPWDIPSSSRPTPSADESRDRAVPATTRAVPPGESAVNPTRLPPEPTPRPVGREASASLVAEGGRATPEEARAPPRPPDSARPPSEGTPAPVAGTHRTLAEGEDRRGRTPGLPSWIAELPPFHRLPPAGPPSGRSWPAGPPHGYLAGAPSPLPGRVVLGPGGCARCRRPLADSYRQTRCEVCGRPLCDSCLGELQSIGGPVRCPDCYHTGPSSR